MPHVHDTSWITIAQFTAIAKLLRRQIYRLRSKRPDGFPTEYELGSVGSKFRRCPRFKLTEVVAWLDSQALW